MAGRREPMEGSGPGGRAAHWQRVIEDWAGSGLSQRAFCRKRRIPVGTFAWWKHQLRLRGESAGRRGPEFLRVRVRSKAKPATMEGRLVAGGTARAQFEVTLPDGTRIRVYKDCDERVPARILELLGARSC
jgi:hypothetical protein